MENAKNINFNAENNYFRSEKNEGNFIGILKLLAGENGALAEHLKKCEENAQNGLRNNITFMSKTFIHNALCVVRNFILRKIVSEIHDSGGHFGIMMDGSQDIACKEQISIVVRYVDNSNNIMERTIGFVNASKDTSGAALYESLRTSLSNLGLSTYDVVGCSFDGAANMRSENVGVQSRIQADNPVCIFTWCISHRFNLVVKLTTSSFAFIKEILRFAEEAAKLFRGSYKRMNVWVEVALEIPNFNPQKRLKLIGTTRWSSKQDAIAAIVGTETHLYVVIKSLIKVNCLPNLEGQSLILASSTLAFWLQYKNVVATFLLHKIFSLLVPTTKYLQKLGLNIVDGIRSLRNTVRNLEASIEMLDSYIEDAQQFIENLNCLLMADSDIQLLQADCRVNFPSEDEKVQINNKIKHEFLQVVERFRDEINEQILNDFDETNGIFHEIRCLDPTYAKDQLDQISFKSLCEINGILNEEEVVKEMKGFLSDFNHRPKYESLLSDDDEEYHGNDDDQDDLNETDVMIGNTGVKHGKSCECFQCVLHYLKENNRMETFRNIYKLYKYVATLPSTQVKCERDFSKMKMIKSRLRSTLSDENLESLIIISTECDMFRSTNLEDIIEAVIASSDKISLYMG